MTLPDDYRDLEQLDDYDLDADLDDDLDEDLEDEDDAQFASDDELDEPTIIEEEAFDSFIEPRQ